MASSIKIRVQDQHGKVLFIIGDEHRDRNYRDTFEYHGFEIDIVHDYLIGMQYALYEGYDFIYIDDKVGNKAGYVIAQDILRKRVARISILRDSMDNLGVIGDYNVGVDFCLPKTTDAIQLVAQCKSILYHKKLYHSKKVYQEDEVITVSEVSLDCAKRAVELPTGVTVKLMDLEVQVLTILMHKPGILVTREEISHEIHGYFNPNEGWIKQIISCIRRKIANEVGEDISIITTVWGRGYIFEVISKD